MPARRPIDSIWCLTMNGEIAVWIRKSTASFPDIWPTEKFSWLATWDFMTTGARLDILQIPFILSNIFLYSVLRLNFWLIFSVNATSFPWHIYHACPYQTLRQENHKQQTNSVRLWQGLQPQTRWAEHGVACPEQLGTEFPRKSVISGNLGIGGLILTFDARPRPWQRINSFFMCLSHAENNVRHFPGDPMGATCLDGEWSPKAIPTCESKNHPSIK